MEKDAVYVGLPYIFKMHYDELKQNVPVISDYLEKLKKFSEKGNKNISDLTVEMTKLKESVSELFQDISTNQPRIYKDVEKKSDSN
ncbi:hypothetical protein M1316_03045 [Candidatus Parvarchaeota archaeon]|jgi:predicted  nucleic acid-binding Zn-ribbon protein|nr:hypothetical protein [Candidatus Parvarchaeota archaeon]